MRIAIIGSGIAGASAAYALSTRKPGAQVTVYEREPRLGGHSATADIDYDGVPMAVDTGFIVYNELNYPNFTRLLAELDCPTEASTMSFSVSADRGRFEWCGRERDVANGLFAQRRNLASPSYWRMLVDILRFQKRALADLAHGRVGPCTLGAYLDRTGFSGRLRDDYLVPMGAAIWSTSPISMLDFPAMSFLEFFHNHRLLQWDRPQWRTISGGSRAYVERLSLPWRARARLANGATRIERKPRGVEITDQSGDIDAFDYCIVATHAPQALSLLADASPSERAVLGDIGAAPNTVFLHRDARLMPRRKAAWAAWNFLREGRDGDRKVAVTYWMNQLQNLDPSRPVFVSLNPPFEPDHDKVFARFSYDHPQFDERALEAQKRLAEIQGQRRTFFCGAWAGHGFHEDGVESGLAAAEALGATLSWRDGADTLPLAAE